MHQTILTSFVTCNARIQVDSLFLYYWFIYFFFTITFNSVCDIVQRQLVDILAGVDGKTKSSICLYQNTNKCTLYAWPSCYLVLSTFRQYLMFH